MSLTIKHCHTCNKFDWSLILFRPSVIALDQKLAPPNAAKVAVETELIKGLTPAKLPTKSRFVLRLLRAGYVHVYLEKPPKGMKQWLLYRVTEEGDIISEENPFFGLPDVNVSCSDSRHNAMGLKLLHIPRADEIDHIWIAYSANLWNAKLREKNKADPKIMQRIERAGGSPNTFAPTADALRKRVLECALLNMTVAGAADHDFPFNSVVTQVDKLAEQLQKAAACHPKTKGHEQAVVLDDRIGFTAELNALRLRWNDLSTQEIEKPENAWPLKSIGQMRGLKKMLFDATEERDLEAISPVMSHGAFESIMRVHPNPRGWPDGTCWVPLEPSRENILQYGTGMGRVIFPDHDERALAWAERQTEATWKRMSRYLDKEKRDAWQKQFDTMMENTWHKPLAQYEKDWLEAAYDPATVAYFENHFDEHDPNDPLVRHSPGTTYSQESNRIHNPAPVSASLHERYLDVLNRPITETSTVQLRALFANQQSVIQDISTQLSGDPGGSDGRSRDVAYYFLKGFQEKSPPALRKFSWINDAVAGFSVGNLTALAGTALTLSANNSLMRPKLQAAFGKLQHLGAFRQTLDLALEAAVEGRTPAIPMCIRMEVPAEVLNARMRKSGVSGTSRAHFKNVMRKANGRAGKSGPKIAITLLTDTDAISAVDGDLKALVQKPDTDVHVFKSARQAVQQASGTQIVTTEARTIGLFAKHGNLEGFLGLLEKQGELGGKVARTLHEALVQGAAGARNLPLTVEGRLAMGCLIVQWIGLAHSIGQYKDAKTPAEVRNALYNLGSFGSGAVSGGLEILQVAVKTRLVAAAAIEAARAGEKALGNMVKEALAKSGPLAGLRVVGNFAGAVCGAYAAMGALSSAADAKIQGQIDQTWAYRTAAIAFYGTAVTSSLTAIGFGADILLRRPDMLISRLGGRGLRQLATRVAKYVRIERVVGEAGAAVEESVLLELGVVAVDIAVLGVIFLGIAGVAYCYVAVTTPSELEKWIGSSYFGKAEGAKRYPDWESEQAALKKVVDTPPAAKEGQTVPATAKVEGTHG